MARFKVGDRVMAVRGCFGYYPSGAVGTVLEDDDHVYYVDFDDHPDVQVKANGARHWYVTTVIAAPVTPTSRSNGPDDSDINQVHASPAVKYTADNIVSISRSNDPATSKGKRRINKYEQAVLEALGKNHDWYKVGKIGEGWCKGMTGKELAQFTDMPLNSITPRLAPLRRKGLIKDSGLRRDKQIVWVLA